MPLYRSQRDNARHPGDTCNVTTLAMVLERLGLGEQAVAKALRSLGPAADPDDPPQSEERLLSWIDDHNLARTRITAHSHHLASAVAAPQGRVVGRMRYHDRGRPPWPELRPRLEAALDAGAGAWMSLWHQGRGHTGSHLVSIQRLTARGVVIDDPWGRLSPAYRRQDATWGYALRPGDGSRVGSNDVVPGAVDDAPLTDHRPDAPDPLHGPSRRGASVHPDDAQVEDVMRYVAWLPRPTAAPSAGEGGTGSPSGSPTPGS